MAAHVSDWGDSLNQSCRGGKRLTMVMMFVWGGGVLDGIIVLFLPWEIYGAGVLRSHLNPYRSLCPVTKPALCLGSCYIESSVIIHADLVIANATFTLI